MQPGKSCGFSLGVIRTINLKSRLSGYRSTVEIGADLGGHIGLFLSAAYLLVRSLQRETRPGWSYGSPQSEHTSAHNGLDCGPSRTGLELAGVVVLVRTCPRPQPLWAVRSLTPWKWRTRLSSSARGLVTLSVGITARRSRPKVWTDPGLCPLSSHHKRQSPKGPQSGSRHQCRPAAVAYERSNRGDEILQRQDGVGGRLAQ